VEEHEGQSFALQLQHSGLEAAEAAAMLEQRLHEIEPPCGEKVYPPNRR
jgi:hypothetical protein